MNLNDLRWFGKIERSWKDVCIAYKTFCTFCVQRLLVIKSGAPNNLQASVCISLFSNIKFAFDVYESEILQKKSISRVADYRSDNNHYTQH